ncbi:MAG: acyltransferase [Lachnospiraceae bacterium]|nr:acyltransferase [Lachnospiraceae bacterium]
MNKETEKVSGGHYGAIDGLKAFSTIGIVLMHVRENTSYSIDGFIYNRLIPSLTNLVFLFMMISAFGMCCGYYERVIHNNITVGEFYSRRYKRVWSYFALLCVLDLLISPSINALYETFANLTLCFGLLPNADISVIGVGWFLGVVFVFYLLFPFFCYLLQDKRRAWFSFGVMVVFNRLCAIYFFDENHVIDDFSSRSSFIYCAVFFMAGGMIFLYKEKLEKWARRYRWIVLALCLLAAVGYFTIGGRLLNTLLLFSLLLIYALHSASETKHEFGKGILENRITRFISSISMEIYLCHMVAFRVIEKAGMLHIFSWDMLNYIVVCCGVVAGAMIFSLTVNKGLKLVDMKLMKNRIL